MIETKKTLEELKEERKRNRQQPRPYMTLEEKRAAALKRIEKSRIALEKVLAEADTYEANTFIFAKSHADFLNQIYGTNYKGFMRSRWSYDENTWVWMTRMDGQIRNGWRNIIVSNNEICEEYVWEGSPTYSNDIEKTYRIAVKIVDMPHDQEYREYHILGKYKYDFTKSTDRKHIFKKIEEV